MNSIVSCCSTADQNLEPTHNPSNGLVALSIKVSLIFLGFLLIGGGVTSYFYWSGLYPLIAFAGSGALLIASVLLYQCIAYVCSSRKKQKEELQTNLSDTMQRGVKIDSKSHLSPLSNASNEENVLSCLEQVLGDGENISRALKVIPQQFFQDKSQQRAKETFTTAMDTILGASVDFPKACSLEDPESLTGVLDQAVFQLSQTQGVEDDIPLSSQDADHLHVYQVASQYNASEAPNRFTPPIGGAMAKSQSDHTQGPLAQRTNPIAFELVTAFLTHLGFNMLDGVLPSAGTTYDEGSPIRHGYLCPDNKNIKLLTDEFKDNFSEAEYVCYSSLPESWEGAYPVYIFLQAAPAIGYARVNNGLSDELQKYAALANYLALFRYGIKLAQETNQAIVLHAAAVGGGVFGNTSENLRWGFEKAALFFQEDMKLANVSVQLEAYEGTGPMCHIAKKLNIQSQARIGE